MPPLRRVTADRTDVLRRAPEVAAFLLVLNGARRCEKLELRGKRIRIGRSPSNGIVLQDPRVTGEHAFILLKGAEFVIYDTGSTNGTYVNGVRVHREPLHDRDEIRVGNTNLMFMHIAASVPADARRRLHDFDVIWNELTQAARRE
jgi:pSer/pThr/pTyr-binding forkhead associated (FHA) protein